TGEVLHEHPGRGVLDFDVTDVLGIPGLQRLNLRGGDNAAILVAQQVLQQHLQAVREPGGSGNTVQSVDFIGLVPHLEGIAGIETVWAHLHRPSDDFSDQWNSRAQPQASLLGRRITIATSDGSSRPTGSPTLVIYVTWAWVCPSLAQNLPGFRKSGAQS